MTTFYLIRHGNNNFVGKTIAGWMPGVHLNQHGRSQAEELAARLSHASIQQIYSSPLDRAQETALPLATVLNVKIQTANEIGEIQFGNWTNQSLENLESDPHWQLWNSYRSGTRAPKGELMLEVQARMIVFLEHLRTEFPNHGIALVSHGDPIKAVVAYYLGVPLDLILRIEISPASISIVELSGAGPRLLCVNNCGKP